MHITVFESPEKLIKKCRYDLKILKDFNLYNLLLIFLKERGVNTEENKTIIIKIDEYIGWLIKNEYVEEFNNDQNKNS